MHSLTPVLLAILICAALWNVMQPKPEVWLGDVSNECIIINPDKSIHPCPENKSELPYPHIPVYVIEETPNVSK